jgi:hypothetical protein
MGIIVMALIFVATIMAGNVVLVVQAGVMMIVSICAVSRWLAA